MAEYSIQQLAKLSGVTTRTLRWYDALGLLKPQRAAENGYRRYTQADVDRLQDILFYRALGVELRSIKACLDDPSFDRLAALRRHLQALEYQRAELDGLIQSVKDTIEAQERNQPMSNEKKFEAFKRRAAAENEAKYGKEVREKYGEQEAKDAQETFLGLSEEQYTAFETLGKTLQAKLEAAVKAGQSPEEAAAREIAELHREWLRVTDRHYTPQRHRGIAQLYVMDERFTAYYDKDVPGCAKFLCDAVQHWIL